MYGTDPAYGGMRCPVLTESTVMYAMSGTDLTYCGNGHRRMRGEQEQEERRNRAMAEGVFSDFGGGGEIKYAMHDLLSRLSSTRFFSLRCWAVRERVCYCRDVPKQAPPPPVGSVLYHTGGGLVSEHHGTLRVGC
eukprot:3448559-Rhodomonas_salina.1